MMQKLIHITSSLQMGGAENTLFQLIRGLHPRGFQQEVICFHAGPFVERIKALGIPVHVVSGYFYQYDIIFLWRLLRALKKSQPDIIHAQLWLANFLARFYGRVTGIPVVCAIHSPLNHNKKNTWVRSFIDKYTAKWACKTVFVARHLMRTAGIRNYIPAERAIVIENGVDAHYLHARAQISRIPCECYEFCSGTFVLGTVGRLVPVKNQLVLIDILARLYKQRYPVRLIIIGEGPVHDKLLNHAAALGVSHLVRIISGIALEYYELFDVFMLPSHAEGLSLSLLEAMSFMVPVIIAHQAGSDVVHHEVNGYVADFTDINAVVKRIIFLMQNQENRQAIGYQGYETVKEHFSWAVMVNSYERLFQHASEVYSKKKQEFDF